MEDKNVSWLNKVLEWVRYHEDEKNEKISKKEKIGCPITLGEYEKIVEEEGGGFDD